MADPSRQQEPSRWLSAFLASLLIHALLLVGWTWHSWTVGGAVTLDSASPQAGALKMSLPPRSPSQAGPPSTTTTDQPDLSATPAAAMQADIPPADPGDQPPVAAGARQLIHRESIRIEQLSPAQREQQLNDNLAKLEAIPQAAVAQAATFLEDVAGVDSKRQMQPVADIAGSDGEFDAASATVANIAEKRDENGQIYYEWLMVDRSGRGLTVRIEAEQMTDQDLTLVRLFRAAEGNPSLKALLQTALKIATARLDQTQTQPENAAATTGNPPAGGKPESNRPAGATQPAGGPPAQP